MFLHFVNAIVGKIGKTVARVNSRASLQTEDWSALGPLHSVSPLSFSFFFYSGIFLFLVSKVAFLLILYKHRKLLLDAAGALQVYVVSKSLKTLETRDFLWAKPTIRVVSVLFHDKCE